MGTLEESCRETAIEGVLLQPLSVISTEGGPVLHLLRRDYALMPYHQGFGEIYFSEVLPGAVKAWKRHLQQSQLFAVPVGQIRLVLYDDREHTKSRGQVQEFLLGRPDNYCLLKIPPRIWYGFASLGNKPALLCNCADLPHDPREAERLPQDSERIPYRFHPDAGKSKLSGSPA